MHRDIKLSNVVVDAEGRARIIDFGLSACNSDESNAEAEESIESDSAPLFRPRDRLHRLSAVGSRDYLSPELVIGEPYDYRVDLWAFGVLAFELLTGRLPFQAHSSSGVLDAIVDAQISWPSGCEQWLQRIQAGEEISTLQTQYESESEVRSILSPAAISLIHSLLQVDPDKRLGQESVGAIIDHPFFDAVAGDIAQQREDLRELMRSSLSGDCSLPDDLSSLPTLAADDHPLEQTDDVFDHFELASG